MKKNIRIIITKIIHVAKIITNTLKKVLFNLVMTKIHNRSIIFAAVGLRLTCGAILLSWFWPEQTSTDNFPGVFQPWTDFYSFQLHSNLNTHFFFEQQVPMISQPFLGLSFWSLRLLCPRSGASHYLLNLLSLIFKPEKTADIWRRHRCMVSPRNAVWGTSTEIPHWWRVTILSWAVLLIGWKFASTYQKRALPRSG